MEIRFDDTCASIYEPFLQQTRRTQVAIESVVPDVNDDIGRIVSVQPTLLMKSKEAFKDRIMVTGEIQAALLYITEEEQDVSSIKLTRSFSLEYEDSGIDSETLFQVRLSVLNTEARILNPRKVSVTIELCSELCAYRHGEIIQEMRLPEDRPEGLHVKKETAAAYCTELITVKTFALNEQYAFPDDAQRPAQLVSQQIAFNRQEPQQVGSRLILKGTVETELLYLAEGCSCPLRASSSSPFSQIFDLGECRCDYADAVFTPTSLYCELIDTISGEKALNLELHAVTQLTVYGLRQLQYISDLYSNRNPTQCQTAAWTLLRAIRSVPESISASEAIPIAEDCSAILGVYSQAGQPMQEAERLSVPLTLDILYAAKDGSLSCLRRSLMLTKSVTRRSVCVRGVRVRELDLRQDGGQALCSARVELTTESRETETIDAVTKIELDMEAAFDVNAFPTLTIVRAKEETLWELAKRYHSGVEEIEKMNVLDGGLAGKLILIPKQL
ncbi:MAG: DUF3794 domain-containing protein [Oscillospiraceae bacterium]|nr:DUF3794 domain-containing protein [Oscillospiraceae bacterium]